MSDKNLRKSMKVHNAYIQEAINQLASLKVNGDEMSVRTLMDKSIAVDSIPSRPKLKKSISRVYDEYTIVLEELNGNN